MSRGVICYNRGQKMAVRIAVFLHSLNRHWDGPVTLIHDGEDGWDMAKAVARRFGVAVRLANFPDKLDCKNATLLNKCQIHTQTSYDTSVLIDTDCIVCGDITELFNAAERSDFVLARFSDWKVKGKMAKRIKAWRGKLPDSMIDEALKQPHATNTGVFAFRRESVFMRDWLGWAKKGPDLFIPDETAAMCMLGTYEYEMLPAIYNVSCKYGKPEHWEDVRISHKHGRKHCRFNDLGQFLNNSHLWYAEFEQIREYDCVKPYIGKDRQLKKHLSTWDRIKKEFMLDPDNDKWYAKNSIARLRCHVDAHMGQGET